MRLFRTQLVALALTVGLAAPALADRSVDTSRHSSSGVIIYFGSGSSHLINDRPGRVDRHGYRQGYRDGYRDGRRDSRHPYRNDHYGHYRPDHGFATPAPGYQPHRPYRSRPNARHGLTAGSR